MVVQSELSVASPQSLDLTTGLAKWRLELLNGLLFATFGISGILVLVASLSVLQNRFDAARITVPAFVGVYALLGVITFFRRLPYLLRAGALLAIAYALGCYDLLTYGLASDGRLYLFTAPILAALLLSRFAAAGFAMVSVGLLALIGWLGHGWSPTTLSPAPNLIFWGTQLASQALQLAVVLVCLAFMRQRMGLAIQQESLAAAAAEANARQATEHLETLAVQKEQLEATQQRLRELVASLETPTVDLADQVILAPLVGAVDERRARAITERLLTTAHSRRIRLVIVDLGGLPEADTASLQALRSTSEALKLLGCRVVFTGFSATVARNFAQLDTSADTLEVRRSPQDVLAQLQQLPPTLRPSR